MPYFPAQQDAEIRDITVGALLREIAASPHEGEPSIEPSHVLYLVPD